MHLYGVTNKGYSICANIMFNKQQYKHYSCKSIAHNYFYNIEYLFCCGWVEVFAYNFRYITKTKTSTCQIEIDALFEKLIIHTPWLSPWKNIGLFRVLSFDIECIFADALHDPIIQIANIVKTYGEEQPFINNCFVVKGCAPVDGSQIIKCNSEKDLILKWVDFFRTIDPDILSGYNIKNFDIPYIIQRAKCLQIYDKVTSYMSRSTKNSFCITEASYFFEHRANWTNKKFIKLEGRVIFDVLQLVHRKYKLPKYSLADMGNDQDRKRIAVYCIKDTFLSMSLLEKLNFISSYIDIANLMGFSLNALMYFQMSQNWFIKMQDLIDSRTTLDDETHFKNELRKKLYCYKKELLDYNHLE